MCLDLLFSFDGVFGVVPDLSNSNRGPKKLVWTEADFLKPLEVPNAIPDSGSRKQHGSPSRIQSGSLRSNSYPSSRSRQNRVSPSTNRLYFAGPKFCQAPPAESLPKPPGHWTNTPTAPDGKEQMLEEMTNLLKMLLNIEA